MNDSSLLANCIGGYFITFEGPEGSGKSTLAAMLSRHFDAEKVKNIVTREPGGTAFGDKVRSLLLEQVGMSLTPETEMFLMLAQRIEHLQNIIQPALKSGITVICDRYFDSSMAYQGSGRGLKHELIRRLHMETLGSFLPNLTILLDVDPEEGLKRAKNARHHGFDRMESEALSFHKRVRQGYIALSAEEPERFLVLDATQKPEVIFPKILERLKKTGSELSDDSAKQ